MAPLINAGSTPVGLGLRYTALRKGYLLSGVDFCWPELPESSEFWLEILGN